MTTQEHLRALPSVDKVLSSDAGKKILADYGHTRCANEIRLVLAEIREEILGEKTGPADISDVVDRVHQRLNRANKNSLIKVINLTGTVLHTNLGRAFLPESALQAVTDVAEGASNLEFDIAEGKRGDRDSHISDLISELTGAEAATIVNNNAAAVLLALNTLAQTKEVCISRGELVEIGGSFRIPEVMEKSGCRLVEVGATNRTHKRDYESALTADTALLLKVHTSNYAIQGFTSEVSYEEIAEIGKAREIPFLADLGSGTLIDLEQYGLPHEPTVQEVLESGVDVVTFSGDKLLGGPQAGIIAGRADLIEKIKANPLKRALRVDKMTMAALVEVLKLYRQPELLTRTHPTIRYLARGHAEIAELTERLLPAFDQALAAVAVCSCIDTNSQIGSGALPIDQLPSQAIKVSPNQPGDAELQRIVNAFRHLPVPIIGRLQDGNLLFDLRTVDDPATIEAQLRHLDLT